MVRARGNPSGTSRCDGLRLSVSADARALLTAYHSLAFPFPLLCNAFPPFPRCFFSHAPSFDRCNAHVHLSQIGAKVLLEIYKKYKDEWIVNLLIDDLVDW